MKKHDSTCILRAAHSHVDGQLYALLLPLRPNPTTAARPGSMQA